MPDINDRIEVVPLRSERLELEPLQVEHATEMAPLLDDARLHAFIGGEPASVEALRERYERQRVGRSADGSELWLNWILRRIDDGLAVGTVQATVTEWHGRLAADVAWVIGTAYQGQGYAVEAATAMVDWLARQGVRSLAAYVHPDHAASIGVARAIGLKPTEVLVDGEIRWETGLSVLT